MQKKKLLAGLLTGVMSLTMAMGMTTGLSASAYTVTSYCELTNVASVYDLNKDNYVDSKDQQMYSKVLSQYGTLSKSINVTINGVKQNTLVLEKACKAVYPNSTDSANRLYTQMYALTTQGSCSGQSLNFSRGLTYLSKSINVGFDVYLPNGEPVVIRRSTSNSWVVEESMPNID